MTWGDVGAFFAVLVVGSFVTGAIATGGSSVSGIKRTKKVNLVAAKAFVQLKQ